MPSHLAKSSDSENRHFRTNLEANGISEKGENGCKARGSQHWMGGSHRTKLTSFSGWQLAARQQTATCDPHAHWLPVEYKQRNTLRTWRDMFVETWSLCQSPLHVVTKKGRLIHQHPAPHYENIVLCPPSSELQDHGLAKERGCAGNWQNEMVELLVHLA